MALPSQQHHDNSDELIARYIETAPAYPTPDRARLGDYGVSVTAIITHLKGVDWNLDETARAYRVPIEAVEAAVAYYERHTTTIDARITLNMTRATGEGWDYLDEKQPLDSPSLSETDVLILRHIETAPAYPTPDVARVIETGVSVTALINWLRTVDWDIEETARVYSVSIEAVRAAIAYYERHQNVIDARITLNNAWFTR